MDEIPDGADPVWQPIWGAWTGVPIAHCLPGMDGPEWASLILRQPPIPSGVEHNPW